MTATSPSSSSPGDRRAAVLRRLLREHPALLLSMAYVVTSTIGMLFSWVFFRAFNVNIFDYAEITDFLMAALREPLSIVLAAGGVMVALLLWLWSGFEQRWFGRHPPKNALSRTYQRLSRMGQQSLLLNVVVITLYAYLFIDLYATHQVDAVRAGHGRAATVVQEGSRTHGLLVGATSRFLFLYTAPRDAIVVVPHESILRIHPDPLPDDAD